MRMKKFYIALCVSLWLMFFLAPVQVARAGSEDLKAGKRQKFQDDSVDTMQSQIMRLEEEKKLYQDAMIANSEKTVKLLERILALLEESREEKR